MQTLALLNPLAYSVDLLRGLLIGMWNFPPLVDLGVLLLFAVVALAAATWSFRQQE